MSADSLLPDAVAAAVPHWLERLVLRGGPSAADWDWLPTAAEELGEHGDLLLYRGKKPGETAAVFNQLCRALAIMAFVPGGVSAFGRTWEVDPEWARLQAWLWRRRPAAITVQTMSAKDGDPTGS